MLYCIVLPNHQTPPQVSNFGRVDIMRTTKNILVECLLCSRVKMAERVGHPKETLLEIVILLPIAILMINNIIYDSC